MKINIINIIKTENLKDNHIHLLIGISIFSLFINCNNSQVKIPSIILKDGMVMIPSGDFMMGSTDKEAREDESPIHPVHVDAGSN